MIIELTVGKFLLMVSGRNDNDNGTDTTANTLNIRFNDDNDHSEKECLEMIKALDEYCAQQPSRYGKLTPKASFEKSVSFLKETKGRGVLWAKYERNNEEQS